MGEGRVLTNLPSAPFSLHDRRQTGCSVSGVVSRAPRIFLIRIYPYRSHLIVHVDLERQVTILRVLGGRQDWQAIPRALD